VSREPVDYEVALAEMDRIVEGVLAGTNPEVVWLLEHPSIYTAGSSARAEELLVGNKFPVYKSGRGGGYTYHGPGQRVVYLMLDLKRRAYPREPDLREYISQLEGLIINTLAEFGVKGLKAKDQVGIWVDDKKIASIGVRVRRWVTSHGIAINISPCLDHFAGIMPCGKSGMMVTSLAELRGSFGLSEFDAALKKQFSKMFLS
jgi:lipoyl(octanoyl) transferase